MRDLIKAQTNVLCDEHGETRTVFEKNLNPSSLKLRTTNCVTSISQINLFSKHRIFNRIIISIRAFLN